MEGFDALDTNLDGRIDLEEFVALLTRLGSRLDHAQRRAHFEALDQDRDGSISLAEFTRWMRQ